MPDALPLVPEVTSKDIEWVRDLMRLDALDAPRRDFLAARSTLDVSACPGSGKTTLVVAKLAILAQKWPHRTRGICVLSHTNVAREQIQRRLGSTVVGQRLLGYPHFIDTIHGFVNRFLALPWLNSGGYPSPTVDNDVTTAYRRSALRSTDYWIVQNFLAKKCSGFDRLRICDRDLRFDLGGRPFPTTPNARSFQLAKVAVEAAVRAGYFCYDEMFIWARALLEDVPPVASWLRQRFPLVMIDEIQDTFRTQGAMLHAVFPRTSPDIVVQRVGDPNQAIFDDLDAEADENEPFPDPDSARRLDIPNSYRFGPEIAALASPFAAMPVGTSGLCGLGPRGFAGTLAGRPHAVFVFPDNSTEGVLDAYGKHVLAVFDDAALVCGRVTAVGAVHREDSDVGPGHEHFPKSVPNYWSGYSAELARNEPNPKTLVQYFRAAQAAVGDGGDLYPGVEKIASGLVRLARSVGEGGRLKCKTRTHRGISDALEMDSDQVGAYRGLLRTILMDQAPVTEANWRAMRIGIFAIARALCDGATDEAGAAGFLDWPTDDLSLTGHISRTPSDAGHNIYRVEDGDRRVDVRLSSIHAVKGQTHLATLVLHTFWHAGSSHQLLPWLLGRKANAGNAGMRDRRRLLHTYVAMTRPSQMVCLAAPRSTFGDSQTFSAQLATLEARGWRVAEIVNGISQWHS